METKTKKNFEVIQIIPSITYAIYHVEAYDEDEAERLVDENHTSVDKISEETQDCFDSKLEYEVTEIKEYDENE